MLPNLFDGGPPEREEPDFDGATYSKPLDKPRLTTQLAKVRHALDSGRWLTYDEIAAMEGLRVTNGIGARIRDLRKEKFGGRTVPGRRRGDPRDGLWEFRMEPLEESE